MHSFLPSSSIIGEYLARIYEEVKGRPRYIVTESIDLIDGKTRLLPLTAAVTVLIWVIATSGGNHVFVKEWLGKAYDSQADHFLRGDVGVDVGAIRSEAMIVNGKVRMYFGPFPAFLRIPLNFVYPEGRGKWSRLSGFLAGTIALFSFAGLVTSALLKSSLSLPARRLLGSRLVVGFVLGSPILFLVGNLSIYNEGIVWGLAWSLAALYFAFQSREDEGFPRPFPYRIIYRVTGGTILVIAVIHVSRHNRHWKNRA